MIKNYHPYWLAYFNGEAEDTHEGWVKEMVCYMGVFIVMGVPNSWMVYKGNHIEIDDLGVARFEEITIPWMVKNGWGW